MRAFYTELIGLQEIYWSEADHSVGYRCGSLQFSCHELAQATPHDDVWAWQPGWVGGSAPDVSWSFARTHDEFYAAVDRLVDAGVPTRHDAPVWNGYWSFPVRDPMGNTVEITFAPEA